VSFLLCASGDISISRRHGERHSHIDERLVAGNACAQITHAANAIAEQDSISGSSGDRMGGVGGRSTRSTDARTRAAELCLALHLTYASLKPVFRTMSQAGRGTARRIDALAGPVEVMLRAHRFGVLSLARRSPCERANRQEEGFNADK
jgi:hypothetical protein